MVTEAWWDGSRAQGTSAFLLAFYTSLQHIPHLILRHLGRSLEFITYSEDSRSHGMLLQSRFYSIILYKSFRKESMKNYLTQVLWLNAQLYGNPHFWAAALILGRAETRFCCNLEAMDMPDGSTLTVLAPPTTQLGDLRSINCTSRRLLVGSKVVVGS